MKAVETDAQIQQKLKGKSEQARPWSRDATNDQYIKWVVFKMSVNRKRLSHSQPHNLRHRCHHPKPEGVNLTVA